MFRHIETTRNNNDGTWLEGMFAYDVWLFDTQSPEPRYLETVAFTREKKGAYEIDSVAVGTTDFTDVEIKDSVVRIRGPHTQGEWYEIPIPVST